MIEMTYEQWRENSKELVAEAKKYDRWRERSKQRLLNDLAPRIGKLAQQFYNGCGFHYAMEQQLGYLIRELAMPIQWSANHCGKIPADRMRIIMLQVSMTMLGKTVKEAEKTAK